MLRYVREVPCSQLLPVMPLACNHNPDVRLVSCADAAFKNVGTEASSQKGIMIMLMAGRTAPAPGSNETGIVP